MGITLNNKNIIRQFVILPIILFLVLFATGSVGIFSNIKLADKIELLSDGALGPTLVFAETHEHLIVLKNQLDDLLDPRLSVEAKEKIIKSIKQKTRKINKLVTEQADKSQNYVFFDYLNKWLVKWVLTEKNIATQISDYAGGKSFENLKSISMEVSVLEEEIANINDFIQLDVKANLADTSSFSNKSIVFLVLTLLVGLLASFFSSLFVVKKVKVLVEEIQKNKKNIENLLNNLAQGYFSFDIDGVIQTGASKICENYYGQQVENKKLVNILPISAAKKSSIADWLQLVFAGDIDFDTLKDLGPDEFVKDEKQYELKYRPIYKGIDPTQLDSIICITADVTEERLLREQAAEESTFVKMLIKAVNDKNIFKNCILEMHSIARQAAAEIELKNPDIKSLFRYLHTLKGISASLYLLRYSQKAHDIESKFAEVGSGKVDIHSIRSELANDLSDLKKLLEQFFLQNRIVFEKILGTSEEIVNKEVSKESIRNLSQMLDQSHGKKSNLYQYFEDHFVLEPVQKLFLHYSDTVEQLAEKLDKKVNFVVEKSNILIDSEKISSLANSFVHMIRNALDHGIENEDERQDLNKNPVAELRMNFSKKEKNNMHFLIIQLSDDGRGINIEKIKQKCITLGLYNAEDFTKMSDYDICQIIFQNGFSTADQVSDTSGRGIGMDAILNEAKRLNGKAWIESESNKGTKLFVEIPL